MKTCEAPVDGCRRDAVCTRLVRVRGLRDTVSVTGSESALWTRRTSATVVPTCAGDGSFARVRDGATVTVDGAATATLSAGEISQEGNCRFSVRCRDPGQGCSEAVSVSGRGDAACDWGWPNTETPMHSQSPGADGWVNHRLGLTLPPDSERKGYSMDYEPFHIRERNRRREGQPIRVKYDELPDRFRTQVVAFVWGHRG